MSQFKVIAESQFHVDIKSVRQSAEAMLDSRAVPSSLREVTQHTFRELLHEILCLLRQLDCGVSVEPGSCKVKHIIPRCFFSVFYNALQFRPEAG